jgi:hypothetical protein
VVSLELFLTTLEYDLVPVAVGCENHEAGDWRSEETYLLGVLGRRIRQSF